MKKITMSLIVTLSFAGALVLTSCAHHGGGYGCMGGDKAKCGEKCGGMGKCKDSKDGCDVKDDEKKP